MVRCFLGVLLGLMLYSSWPAAAAEPPPAISEYRLGPGDEIKILVLGVPDLSLDFILSDAGTISFPFLGEVYIKQMTASKLEAYLQQHLSEGYLVNPKVNVRIVKYRPFFVSGEVARPGGYPYQPALTVYMAVTLAGGFTERAARRDILVIHEDDPDHEPKEIGLSDRIRPGDIIVVEESFF
jgi:protein involved in polysaccharide export with SLBB domain